jgi:subtilisin family serine protease
MATQEPAHESGENLPAWSLPADAGAQIAIGVDWPERVTREWAWGDSTGEGMRVCILDSGVERGAGFKGSGLALLAGLRWAVEQGFDVINMSLSTTKRQFAALLHELADSAYFRRTLLVASAHNMPVESYPWRFSSVISVGSHEEPDPLTFYYNPNPPVEFFARGVGVEIAWLGGGTIRSSGNSFATPHMTGICALILAKHPELTPFQLKSVLYLTANNVGGGT